MALFLFSIPLMVVAIAIAVVPLIALSRSEHHDRVDTARPPSQRVTDAYDLLGDPEHAIAA